MDLGRVYTDEKYCMKDILYRAQYICNLVYILEICYIQFVEKTRGKTQTTCLKLQTFSSSNTINWSHRIYFMRHLFLIT